MNLCYSADFPLPSYVETSAHLLSWSVYASCLYLGYYTIHVLTEVHTETGKWMEGSAVSCND